MTDAPLLLSVQSLPLSADIPALISALTSAFSLPDNGEYLSTLAAAGRSHTPARVTAARLGALALLPPLLRRMGHDPAMLLLRRDAHGRPYITDRSGVSPVDFNLSHSATHVVCACVHAPWRVGVDVEDVLSTSRAAALTQRYCTEGERDILDRKASLLGSMSLAAEDTASAFTCLWTVREAISKYEGGGMPLRYDAAYPPNGIRLIGCHLTDGAWLTLCCSAACTSSPTWIIADDFTEPVFDVSLP